ncbi:MAG: hypothetical protein IK127_06205 [Clostridia bacterium]|nr:hypothetical protein [Clostridia bacterium]
MRNKYFAYMGLCTGILAIIFAIILFAGGDSSVTGMDTGTQTSYEYYGGDAYTGIQQAAADTARNVQALAKIVKTGFEGTTGSGNAMGYLLLVIGLWLIAHSLHILNEMKVRSDFEAQVLSLLQHSNLNIKQSEPAEVSKPTLEQRW